MPAPPDRSSHSRSECHHPGRGFFDHVRESSRRMAGRHAGKACATANQHGAEPIGLRQSFGRQDARDTATKCSTACQLEAFADWQCCKRLVNRVENCGQIFGSKGLIFWTVSLILQQLCQQFPEHLIVDGTENSELAAAREKV